MENERQNDFHRRVRRSVMVILSEVLSALPAATKSRLHRYRLNGNDSPTAYNGYTVPDPRPVSLARVRLAAGLVSSRRPRSSLVWPKPLRGR